MDIIEQLVTAFPQASSVRSVDESFILANPNVMELRGPTDLLNVVPAYLLWCAENPQNLSLASTYTLGALAEYGRCKSRGVRAYFASNNSFKADGSAAA